MKYEKQTWVDNVSPLNAERMNHIEDGVSALSEEIDDLKESGGAGVVVDATLSIHGAAADAAKTGEIAAELEMGSSKNLNVTPYETRSQNGVTFNVNDDNSITLSGTATNDAFAIVNGANDVSKRFILPAGTYTISGTQGFNTTTYACLYDETNPTVLVAKYGGDNEEYHTFTTDREYLCFVQVSVNIGKIVDGITVYPQLERGYRKTSYMSPFRDGAGRLGKIENKIKALEEKVTTFEVPDYYFDNGYLPERIATVKAKMQECAGKGDAFIFITDQHWTLNAGNSPVLINYISNNLHINKVISGGDMGDSGSWIEFNSLLRKCFPGRVFHTLGNHEYFYPNTGSMLEYHLNMYNEDVRTDNAERNYYYYDNSRAKVRYIMLSAFMPATESSGGALNGHETEQVEWLVNDALNVEDGWTIIVCTHMIHYMDLTTFKLTAPTAGGQAVLDALDAYNANESSKGKVACVIQGHTHHDRITHTTGGIPIVIVSCDKCEPWISSGTNMEPWLSTRVAGTITEQAFEIVVLDKEAQELHFYRIGGDAFNGVDDDPGSPVNLRTVTY